ncbi:hypothetical protein N2152v2_000330 [Parachlorella kessleri]
MAHGSAASNGDTPIGDKLVGYTAFKRNNPRSDKFTAHRFHHVEFWTGEANMTWRRFSQGLGMTLVAKSDQSTGNHHFASYVVQSHELTFTITAPYSRTTDKADSTPPCPWYDQQQACDMICTHGLFVRAIGVRVEDAAEAYRMATANGGIGVTEPQTLTDGASGQEMVVSEIQLFGDCLLRFVSGGFQGPYLPGYEAVKGGPGLSYGLERLDHAVSNVHDLMPAVRYLAGATGFHEFAEFTAADVGTVDSGLNSMVLASNNEMVLLPVNEPTFGTKRKSQIQTYLEQNEGPGLQHLALKTSDIFRTLKEMRARTDHGGFEFMPRPSQDYYHNLPNKIGPILTPEQYVAVEELGLLVDKDDQGVLLQIFTKPLGDRPTVFIEIIQRLCQVEPEQQTGEPVGEGAKAAGQAQQPVEEIGGCGGFGKGNFSELFKSIEVYETDLGIN